MLRCHATNTAAGQRAKLRNGHIIIEAKCHTIIKPNFYYLGPFFFSFSASLAATEGGNIHKKISTKRVFRYEKFPPM